MHDSISRRTFIRSTAAATLVGSAAMKSAGQSDQRLRIGLVGVGRRGHELLRLFRSIEQAKIVAICDDYRPHLDNARQTVSRGYKPYQNFKGMMTNETLDAVVIATPPEHHHAMCTTAVKRGLGVFCETPMGLTIDEARDLVGQVETNKTIFQLGLQRRSNAVYEQAEAMVRTGLLGDITAVKCQWHLNNDERRPVPVSKGHPDFARLDRKLNWQFYRSATPGLVAEYGSHQLDAVNRLLGVAPTRVIGMGGVDYWQDGRETYDNVFCTYEYHVPGKSESRSRIVRATFSAIQTNAHEGVSELMMGTKGTLLLSPKMGLYYREHVGGASREVDGVSGATVRTPGSPWAHRGKSTEITSVADDTRASLVSFVDAVNAGDRDTVCDARIGLENTATTLIANEAIETGRPVEFPDDCRQGG